MNKDFTKYQQKPNLHFILKQKYDNACCEYQKVKRFVPLAMELVQTAKKDLPMQPFIPLVNYDSVIASYQSQAREM